MRERKIDHTAADLFIRWSCRVLREGERERAFYCERRVVQRCEVFSLMTRRSGVKRFFKRGKGGSFVSLIMCQFLFGSY